MIRAACPGVLPFPLWDGGHKGRLGTYGAVREGWDNMGQGGTLAKLPL